MSIAEGRALAAEHKVMFASVSSKVGQGVIPAFKVCTPHMAAMWVPFLSYMWAFGGGHLFGNFIRPFYLAISLAFCLGILFGHFVWAFSQLLSEGIIVSAEKRDARLNEKEGISLAGAPARSGNSKCC